MATQSTRAPLINHELNQSICLKRASLPQSLTSTTLHASQPLSGYMAMQHHPINPYLYRWRVPLCMQSEQPMTVHAGAPAYHPYLSLWRASLNRPPAGRSNHFHALENSRGRREIVVHGHGNYSGDQWVPELPPTRIQTCKGCRAGGRGRGLHRHVTYRKMAALSILWSPPNNRRRGPPAGQGIRRIVGRVHLTYIIVG